MYLQKPVIEKTSKGIEVVTWDLSGPNFDSPNFYSPIDLSDAVEVTVQFFGTSDTFGFDTAVICLEGSSLEFPSLPGIDDWNFLASKQGSLIQVNQATLTSLEIFPRYARPRITSGHTGANCFVMLTIQRASKQ